MRELNLIYVVNTITQMGGIEKLVLDKADFFIESLGYNVGILVLENEEKDEVFFKFNSKIQIYKCHLNRSTDNIIKRVFILTSQFIKVIYKERPDYIIFTRPFFLENAVCSFCFPKIKRIIELHACYEVFNYGENYFNNFKKEQDKSFERNAKKIFPYSTIIITETKRDAKLWEYTNIMNIPNFANILPILETESRDKIAVSLGRLSFQKGFDYLIKSWIQVKHKHPDWRLEIWGYGEDKKKLEEIIKTLNLDNSVFLKGYSKNPAQVYSDSSFYIMSSRYEGSPVVLFEAQKCGLPIISFDLPSGPSEIVNDGIDGFLCNYLDINDLSEKIEKLIEDDKLRKSMSEKAILNAENFTVEKVINLWINLFESYYNVIINTKSAIQIQMKSLSVIFLYIKADVKTILRK